MFFTKPEEPSTQVSCWDLGNTLIPPRYLPTSAILSSFSLYDPSFLGFGSFSKVTNACNMDIGCLRSLPTIFLAMIQCNESIKACLGTLSHLRWWNQGVSQVPTWYLRGWLFRFGEKHHIFVIFRPKIWKIAFWADIGRLSGLNDC